MTITLVDQTQHVWQDIFGQVLDGTVIPREPSAYCMANQKSCKDNTNRMDKRGFWRGRTSLDPIRLPLLPQPLHSWPFIGPAFSQTYKSDIWLDVDSHTDPPAGYTVRIFTVHYGTTADLPPRFIIVAFPIDLDLSKPLSFLLYFQHQPGQGSKTGLGYFNPLGFDWMFYQGWSYLNYNFNTFVSPSIIDLPLLKQEIDSLGLPYQLRKAGKPYVLVMPHINREYDSSTGKVKNYQFYDVKVVMEVLKQVAKELQKDAAQAPKNVAIASFSSGCNLLAPFLRACVARLNDPDPDVKAFVTGQVKEAFVFDPSADFGNDTVAAIDEWRTKIPSPPLKCVRFYTQKNYDNFTKWTGGVKLNPRFDFFESTDKSVTIAYMPFAPPNNVWKKTLEVFFPATPSAMPIPRIDGGYLHVLIPAFFLTDAARRSLHT